MSRVPNPIRLVVLCVGRVLVRVELVSSERARRITELAWPRIVTGVARMSKSAVDVAMVGVALGSTAIAGVGLAGPYWGLAFAAGGGLAAGTIALVSQRFGAEELDELGQAVRTSVVIVVGLTVPISIVFFLFPTELISVLSDDAAVIDFGASYLRYVGLGVPFAGLNLIGSRVFIGIDDAWTPMIVRSGGAISNLLLNAVLILGLQLGVVGAAIGTVASNVLVTGTFALLLLAGRVPGGRELPIQIDPLGPYLNADLGEQLLEIGVPVIGRNLVWTVAEFPMLAILTLFGSEVVAAFVIARRIWGLMNTPGWGFGLAASSLVGQTLGRGDETAAEAYGREIVRFAVAVYLLSAALVFLFTEPIVMSFVSRPDDPSVPIAVSLVSVACLAVVLQGVSGGAAGLLDASGDTRWTFFSQALGMFCCSIPLTYLGATTSLGLTGLYLAFVAETAIPATLNYYRFVSNTWKEVSRDYRVDTRVADD
ncbi:MATE family efflux transporter [Halocatena pleomorpha]|uniref:Multidrug-efflux transporter n=1 Tax=Halocatena pleomorpha TaxID=1785090 RepID=A0A3P3RLG9_9EURY|nr:MATE family efflux transporter [Halocatena pleomorpha]RRJ33669.1 MATE family efflux transporter [Halocatena pleomorpha]